MKRYAYSLLLSLICIRLSSQVQPTISVTPFDSNRVECRVHGGNADQTQSYVPPSAFPSSLIVTCSAPGAVFKIYYMDMLLATGEGFDDPALGAVRRNTYCAVLNYIASTFSMNPATPGATTLDIFVDQSATPINSPAPPGTQTLAVGGPFFAAGGYGVASGFYGGNFRTHVLTGIDPDLNNYDGQIRVNFDQALGQPVQYWDDYLNTASSCKYDLFTILLHETTHMMGWLSAVGESAAPAYTLAILSNNSNIPSFTEFDKIFLYRGDITTAGSFQKLVTVSPPGLGAPAGISGLLRNFPATGNLGTWMTSSVAPYNHKAYDAFYPFHNIQGNGFSPNAFLSHLDMDLTSYVRASQFSPGYQQRYVMAPFIYKHAQRREYTFAELRYLFQLGYLYNTAFAASTSLSNGATTNANLLNNNVAPYRSNYANPANNIWYFPAHLSNPSNVKNSVIWPETKNADFTILLNQNCPPGFPTNTQLTINLSTFPTSNISDPNGDPIYIFPNSLYGIRGVSTGTSVNNHDCIVQTSSNTVVYTPPPGFIGRAEFAFQMWDGKEPGGIKNITIDVLNNGCTLPCGSELMLNGNTEDATQAKTISNTTIPNSSFNDDAFIYGPNYGDHFAGSMPYGNLLNASSSQSGTHRKESTQTCLLGLNPPPNGSVKGFGNTQNTWGTVYATTPGAAGGWPTGFPNNSNNECYVFESGNYTKCNYRTLITPLVQCNTYSIEFDLSFNAYFVGMVGQPYTFTIEALNSIIPDFTAGSPTVSNYTSLQSIPITVTISAITSTVLNTNWQHVNASFFYCGTNARYLSFKGFPGTYIDNLSLKRSCSPPPPLILGANATSTLLCPGSSATLQAFAINSSCSTNFTWQPGNIVSQTIAITFTSATQSYTLLANDGCRTASAVVNPVPLPVGSFTVPPICIGNCSNDLYTLLPAGTPTNGSFSGPNVSFPFCIPNPCAFVCLTGGTYTPGIYNYTYTIPNNLNCLSTYTFNMLYLAAPIPTIGITGGGTCINAGQSLTLTALTNPSTGVTYTWMPGGANTNSIVISPTATTVYSVTTSNGACTATASVTINVIPSYSFVNTPTTLCTGTYIYYLENWLPPGIPTGGVWTVPFTTSPTGTPGLTAGYLNPNITPLGIQTISYSYTLAPGCVSTNQFTVNIIPGFVLNTNGLSTYCTNLGLGAVISATATPSLGVTYTWQPGNLTGPTQTVSPPVQTIYTVIASNGPCTFQDIVTVQVSSVCCPANNYINSSIIGNTSTPTFFTGQWAINQNVTVIGEVILQGEFLAAANVSITVSPNATLTSDRNGVHIYSCGDMWQGIDVLNGGHVKFASFDVIEDAIEAARSIGSTNTSTVNPTIWLLNTTLNRCKYGVVIKNYNQLTTNSPFVLTNCVFTSRNLNITPGSLTFLQWTAATAPALLTSNGTSVLATPYTVGGYPSANLKAPNAGRPTFAGVYLENNGASFGVVNPTPVYFSILVGDISKPASPCLFDNLMYGIYSKNSNFISRSNIFQNTRRFVNPPKSYIGGVGIYAVNDLTNTVNPNSFFTTVDPALPGTSINHFYDCHFGIYAYNIHQIDTRFDDYRSTQSNPNNNGPLVTGQFAIYTVSNKFKNYQIRSNRIQNISTGIYVAAYPAAMNMPPFPNFGAYMDRIFITSNFFSPALSATAVIGSGYINYAVVAVSNISGFSGANTFYTPGAQLSISTNTMDRVFRGSYVSDFSNKNFTAFTANNGITLVLPPNPPSPQHGIEHILNTADVVNTNTVVGTVSTLNNSNVVGVYRSMNSSGSTQCNSVTSVYAGFEFAGANVGAFWRNNILNTNRRGLQLTNNAILSAQGSTATPSDNLWQGNSWSPANLNTWTDNSTFPVNSKLYVRTVPVGSFNPVFNANQGFFITQTYVFPITLLSSNNNAPFAACVPVGGGGGCNNCSPAMISSLESIVQDSIQYLGNVTETSEINKNIAFTNVINEPTLTVASPTINTFFNNNIQLTRGKYSDIESNIKQGNFNQASALIANFSPATNIENNYKDFYSILKNYLSNGSISNQEDATLSQIANKCPFVDGGVVYDARNLYSVINENVIVYNDQNCDRQHGGGHDGRMISPGISSSSKSTDFLNRFDLIPNPASDRVKIAALDYEGNIKVTIRDLAGKLLFEKDVAIKDHFAILELDLLNGMYLIELSNGNYRENKKIVISK